MAAPFFHVGNVTEKKIALGEDTSKYVISVLRMQNGEEILLTDGRGSKAKALIVDDNRKRCTVEIVSVDEQKEAESKITIAISLLKNTSRFEWFVEKATEIGVSEIIPLICERTEKEKFRFERLQQILVSAMLQSQQCWLPVLQQPTSFQEVVKEAPQQNKFIAHCLLRKKKSLQHSLLITPSSSLILIGPEGDFTTKEIEQALQNNFQPVALGETRLRTETAGVVAAAILKLA